MSLAATNYVLKRRFGNQTRKLLMIVLADYAGELGESWPSIDTLATKAECSRRSVQEHLSTLEKAGEILIYPNAGPKGTNRYRIVFRKSGEVEADLEGVQDLHGGVQMGDAQTAGGGADGRRSFAPEPLRTSYEPSGTYPLPPKGGASGHADALSDEELIRRWRSLRPTWSGPPVLTSAEQKAFQKHRHIMVYWTDEDWPIMREFLNAPNVKGSAYMQWDVMKAAMANCAGLNAQAKAWKEKQRHPRFEVVPKVPDGPPATPEDVAEMMAVLKPQVRRVNS